MLLALTVRGELAEEAREELTGAVREAYRLARSGLRLTAEAPRTAKEKGGGETVLFGGAVKGAVHPMTDLNPKMGNVVVAGKVFFADFYETRRPGVFCLTFDMTDFQGSVRVTKYMQKEEPAPL